MGGVDGGLGSSTQRALTAVTVTRTVVALLFV